MCILYNISNSDDRRVYTTFHSYVGPSQSCLGPGSVCYLKCVSTSVSAISTSVFADRWQLSGNQQFAGFSESSAVKFALSEKRMVAYENWNIDKASLDEVRRLSIGSRRFAIWLLHSDVCSCLRVELCVRRTLPTWSARSRTQVAEFFQAPL